MLYIYITITELYPKVSSQFQLSPDLLRTSRFSPLMYEQGRADAGRIIEGFPAPQPTNIFPKVQYFVFKPTSCKSA